MFKTFYHFKILFKLLILKLIILHRISIYLMFKLLILLLLKCIL